MAGRRVTEEWLSPAEVCEHVPGMTVRRLERMRGEGRGPRYAKPSPKTVVYALADVHAWVAASIVPTRDQSLSMGSCESCSSDPSDPTARGTVFTIIDTSGPLTHDEIQTAYVERARRGLAPPRTPRDIRFIVAHLARDGWVEPNPIAGRGARGHKARRWQTTSGHEKGPGDQPGPKIQNHTKGTNP